MCELLPFLEQADLARKLNYFDDSKATVLPVLLCPSDPRDLTGDFSGTVGGASGTFGLTSYAGVVGTEQHEDLEPTNGVFDTSRAGIRFAEVRDGLSTTLLLGERPPSIELAWGWWSYSDYDNLLATRANYPIYALCGKPDVFQSGSVSDRCASQHFWSPHAGGGASWAFADGSVRWLTYDAGARTITLSTRAGGEAVNLE
jgi:prepilin-type processing-associated H-X9-DG protein